MAARLILVHSPLLGPYVWRPVGELLGADTPTWPRLATLAEDIYAGLAGGMATAIRRAGDDVILVAHSGAGAVVASVAARMPRPPKGVIFCDAILPHPGQSWFDTAPATLGLNLRAGAEGGMLPSWDRWWPPGALERLVPDPAVRGILVGQLEPIPVGYFEESAPAADLDAPCAYLQLSGAYDDEARLAGRQGWPVVRLPLHHLAMLTHAQAVATALEGLAARLEATDG